MQNINKKIIILGAGPCGLGAGHRLKELGHSNFLILESHCNAGGLASTEIDENNFLWDMGGHVIFSHYQYFDDLMNDINKNWCYHKRDAFVWMKGTFIPYPLQNNIHHLPQKQMQQCLNGLIEVEKNVDSNLPVNNFDEWLEKSFGSGLCEVFLRPYNRKVWGVDPSEMNATWVGERVSTVTVSMLKKKEDDTDWGPNKYFQYPMYGGTGAIWSALANSISDEKFIFNSTVVKIDSDSKTLILDNGTEMQYDILVSTIPLDHLCTIVRGTGMEGFKEKSLLFQHSSTHIVGLGFDGQMPSQLIGKCWMYFPEDNCVFYRATVFSKYSPYNVPLPGQQWSFMFEVVETNITAKHPNDIIDEVIEGAVRSGLISNGDCECIISRYHKRLEYGYPIPFLSRDELCEPIFTILESKDIFSRGRFGAWKYEVSNQDHSLMQGVEVIDRLLLGHDETTFNFPSIVNSTKTKK